MLYVPDSTEHINTFKTILLSYPSTKTCNKDCTLSASTKNMIFYKKRGIFIIMFCKVGMKGSPANLNRGLDCDVIVAEVRATSHKPDEIYGIIERLSPGTRKIELFGRPHNVQPNW